MKIENIPSTSAIQILSLTKQYKGSSSKALNGVSFSIRAGSVFGILGPNGAGKTTLISILCGLLKPTQGDALIHKLSIRENVEEIKPIIGVVPQDIALYPSLTLNENLQYMGNMYGLRGKLLKQRIQECIAIVGLEQHANKYVQNFSGGMKRRANLIAGILHQPKVLFLDEPTVGIDVQSRNLITEYLHTVSKQGTTIIYTSHLMEEAENLCSDVVIMDNGELIARGTPKNLIREHGTENMEQLFLKLTGKKIRD